MRKRNFVLAAGIAAMMMLTAGCSPQAQETEPSVSETEVTTTADVGEKTGETGEEEKSQAESEDGTVQEESSMPESVADSMAPLKIWGTVTEVSDRAIFVDNQSPNSSSGEIILTVDPETTRILDGVDGFPVDMKDIEIGSFEAYLGPAMTLSLPPQATPYVVIVNIPEDYEAAQYVIAADSIKEDGDEKVLAGMDGKEYILAEEVSIIPFLTRQMVQLEDIEKGSECLVWLNGDEKVERIVLFQE